MIFTKKLGNDTNIGPGYIYTNISETTYTLLCKAFPIYIMCKYHIK